MAEEGTPARLAEGKLRAFVSYSRDDLHFADQLVAGLELTGFDPTIDRQAIAGGEDWQKRLGSMIRDADTIVFVLSPASAVSERCAWEVEEAARLHKRILPIVCVPLDGASPPSRLQDLNYIFFYPEPKTPDSGWGVGLADLVEALNTDLDWLREHTRLLQRATEWDTGGRPTNRLLFGDDIAEAKAWASRRPTGAPAPTALHLDFIRASEEEEAARASAESKRLEEMAAALEKAQIAQSRFLAEKGREAIKAHDYVTGVLLAMEALPDETARIFRPVVDGVPTLLDAAHRNLLEKAVLAGHTNAVLSAAFSPDGTRVVTASFDSTARVWDAATGKEAAVLTGHTEGVTSAAFSPDGTRVVTASWDNTARLWDVPPALQALVDAAKARVPRGLTLKQRTDEFFLDPEPPGWCYEMAKWPYQPRQGSES